MRILIYRALGLGDLLTAVPALRAIRRAHPAALITLAGPAALGDLAVLSGAVDRVHDAAPLAPLAPADLAEVELAVNLHGRGPQSTAVLQALRPARLVSYGLTSTWRPDEHEVSRWCRLVAEAGMPADPLDLRLVRPVTAAPVEDAVVLHPGAAFGARRWPAERWATVARGLSDGRHRVVVTGGPGEVGLAEEVAGASGLPAEAVLAGRTSALQLAALVASARLVIAPDTGVAHLATAYGTPSVLLFGPTPPALWGPPTSQPQHRVLWAGQVGDPCAPDPDPGLLALSADQVLAEALDALRAATPPTVRR